ncbi:MaoC family dehydratase [Euzebya tangerina]|uniref:MaoC family dehydratase n=1 Tax=Euzebya tangerina TaxID=591198 RepID=UPI000E30B8BB|nr:MaoC family dehydratase [Euzebya tangerina]
MSTAAAPVTTIAMDDLPSLIGTELGPTAWRDVTQEDVDTFADVTGDHQWIHIDPERAAEGPFGQTIAHGFLTLSLVSVLIGGLLEVTGSSLTVNYGLNKVRFPAPVPVGTAVRATGVLTSVEEITGGLQGIVNLTIERDGGTKPVCVAEVVFRYYA